MVKQIMYLLSVEDLRKELQTFFDMVLQNSPELIPDGYLSQKDAARFLGRTEQTLINYKKRGLIPFEQFVDNGKVRYHTSDLMVFKSKLSSGKFNEEDE
jgi:hypothetical protein